MTAATDAGRTVGVFGGSFNPPHVAHMLACVLAVELGELDELLVIPTFVHPFAKELAPYEHRMALCDLAMAHLPRVTVSRVEQELGGESRTVRTIEHLREADPSRQLRLVIGADVLAEASKWHRFDDIVALAPPLVLGRAGVAHEGAPVALLPQVSSTEVRAWLASGDPRLELTVPPAVRRYVRAHGLYGAKP